MKQDRLTVCIAVLHFHYKNVCHADFNIEKYPQLDCQNEFYSTYITTQNETMA